ncbi:MAG: rRNA methyltransferase [Bacteroidetes bacterium HGW-Bacteroidetes-21]|jgi:tRNA (guanosine-2'-O-)-methyltransferase|nr:MAG: rRNA methyltransferase [Bacteroidetes bacterium HGW-Bacteroidetes-21]
MSSEKAKLIQYLSEFATENRFELFAKTLLQRTRYFTVVVENLYQSHNASAVLRTCDCLGIQDVCVIEKNNEFKVSEDIALGASKWLNINKYEDEKKTLAALRSQGYRIIATSSHKSSVMLNDFDIYKGKSAIFMGNEVHGLSDFILSEADEHLKIPMYGFTESYNISVSAAIILYTLIQKIKYSDINYLLSEHEKEDVMLEWLKSSIKDSANIINRYHQK